MNGNQNGEMATTVAASLDGLLHDGMARGGQLPGLKGPTGPALVPSS